MKADLRQKWDVVVIGGGHAGVEASLAAARLGCSTLLLTQNLDTIGQMSCNPAIGGSAKGHIVKEIDALGGAMGLNADATGLQFRRLNMSKGPAVWATRVQCDKKAYQFRMKSVLESAANVHLLQASAAELLVEKGAVRGLRTDLGLEVATETVVITAGTFLRGLLHIGETSKTGGRMGDPASRLSENLIALGFSASRFKTGTPCRINGRSIDFSKLQPQSGDEPPPRFSSRSPDTKPNDYFTLNFKPGGVFHVEQLPCWITQTSAATHHIVRRNLHRSPLYQRRIEGIGPRYCPSLEDKVVRFPTRESHAIFIEPEGRHSQEYYVNGVSTSMPFDVQLDFVRSIVGLEAVEILRPGYAVEYDYFPPTQLRPTLETRCVANLFFAGQVNGTSGYEEAAAQGLLAGANAALKAQGRPSLVLDPQNSYIGVLIDDLTTRGTDEPYRMFTSRAENRLALREDNADLRLTEAAAVLGLADAAALFALEGKRVLIEKVKETASSFHVNGTPLSSRMRDPGFDWGQVPADVLEVAPWEIWQHVAAEAKYAGYRAQQARRSAIQPKQPIPDGIDFTKIPGLRNETRQKLSHVRPNDLAGMRRIPGITAADVAIMAIWLKTKGLQLQG